MKIARRVFTHPSGEFREVEVTKSWWWGHSVRTETQWVGFTLSEVLAQAQEFVNAVGPSRLVNVVEYTSAHERVGDDGRWTIVVWYWEEEASEVRHGEELVQRPEHHAEE